MSTLWSVSSLYTWNKKDPHPPEKTKKQTQKQGSFICLIAFGSSSRASASASLALHFHQTRYPKLEFGSIIGSHIFVSHVVVNLVSFPDCILSLRVSKPSSFPLRIWSLVAEAGTVQFRVISSESVEIWGKHLPQVLVFLRKDFCWTLYFFDGWTRIKWDVCYCAVTLSLWYPIEFFIYICNCCILSIVDFA